MKRVFKPINGVLVALAILAVVGCKRNEEIEQPGDGVLRIVAGVRSSNPAGVTTMAQTATAAKILFADGDKMGLYVTRAEDTLKLASNMMRGFEYSNLLYTRAGGAFGTAVGSPAGTVYYPYQSVNVDLWGIYPYDADAMTKNSAIYPWSVKVEQNTAGAILESDFLAVRVKGVSPSVSTPVPLEFEHKTSRLYMKVQVPTEIDGKELKMDDPLAEVYFEGMTNVGKYNFNTNVFGPDPLGAIVTMPPLARGSEAVDDADASQGIYLYYELLGIPQTVKAGDLFVRIIVNYQSGAKGLFLLETQQDIVLQQGKQHLFEIGFDNNQRLRLDGTKILDWDEVSHTNADLDESETIRVGNVEWSMGNLVANGANGCKIGEPTDGGLYFHFGSLIGWSGGDTGDGTGAAGSPTLEIKVKPSAYAGSTTWPAGHTTTGNVSLTANSAAGTGDPCRYYLGSPWRLPTNVEHAALYSNVANGTAWTACATGAWQATPAGSWAGPGAKLANGATAIFLPASGHRSNADGSFNYIGSNGWYWSSVETSTNGYRLNFHNSGIYPQDGSSRTFGFAIRCVKDAVVTDQPGYIVVDGLKWTTGNLVADGANGCKVGKPEDGGLYFQFGSLIGWKGGATGDGTGRAAKADGTFYGGASFNASNEVQVVPAPFTTITNIGTTWPSQLGTNLYYFGYSTIPYESIGTNINDFSGFSIGTLASSGIGDPCRYYLGGTWRLPTDGEIRAMHDAATSKTYPGSWTNGVSTDSYMVFTFSGGTELKFPAVGRRTDANGAISEVGDKGHYWSSSVRSSTAGRILHFFSGTVYPQSEDNRKNGISVRCVSN